VQDAGGRWGKADSLGLIHLLIGAHVSTAGGLAKAVERGVERECDAIQVFNQSPRMWRPTNYGPADYSAFREAFEASRLGAVTIHAVYLINCASKEREIRQKSIASLTHALRIGDGIGAAGVVLHAGARKGEPHRASMRRAAKAIAAALEATETCPVLLENTAGTQGPLGRDFGELGELLELLDGHERVGICLDCCHLLASGYEIRDPESMAAVVDDFDATVGLDRLRCLHVNDSKIPLGGNRDRHANLGEGELGDEGLTPFLSEPRFQDMPALIETQGPDGHGPDRAEVAKARALRERGLASGAGRGRRTR
jgi:deoxyribonuclease-4